MTAPADLIFLFDVDNTLIDNDRVQDDLRTELKSAVGDRECDRYWAIFEELREKLGYADYLGALERLRIDSNNQAVFGLANWLLDYPFADRLYPGALDAVRHVQQWGPAAILSDGDAVFQPRKIARSGLWDAFRGNVLIYVHKELELEDVERRHPAKRYVLVDDKARILMAIKKVWGPRITTVFPRQGHYASQATPEEVSAADIAIDHIGDLASHDLRAVK